MGFGGITLSDLNNYMRNYPSRKVVADEITDAPLLEVLRNNIDTEAFRGDNIEILVKTKQPFTGKAHYEDADIPYPKDTAFVKQLIPLREVIVNAGLTRQAMMRATGGAASWGRIVDDVLRDQQTDFKWLLNLACMGNGSASLARVSTVANAGGVTTVTCDNTYTDFGWENVSLLKTGMQVEIRAADGTLRTPAGGVEVGEVSFGSRRNGAATHGSFVFAAAGTLNIADNDIVYLYDSKDKLPMGLLGIVQDGVHYSGVAQTSTFQNLARADYSSLRARVYQATDFGLPSEDPADGVPTGWDLSVISDAIADSWRGGGKGRVDMLLCSANLAMAIMRRNRSESNISVHVSSTANENQGAVGSMYANKFIAPDGRLIPIKVAETIPENCLYGLCLDDLNWYPFGDFDFVREYGEIWEPSRGDRKTNVEAPYGGFYNIGAERCDNCFTIQDMRTDI